MPKGQRKYNGTQKVEIIKRIHRENLSFKGASREYGISDRTLRDWERIYWEEGEEALLTERRGRACVASGTQKGRKPKLNKQVEEDLIAENQRLRMEITDMLEGAFQKLPDKVDNLILHSDQGWQYQMKSYQNLLKAKGITQSMSRKATCLDNAVAENFFGLLKTELFYLEKFDSIDQLEKAIVDYIDYYNNRRIKLKLNGLSPVQYRIQTVGAA